MSVPIHLAAGTHWAPDEPIIGWKVGVSGDDPQTVMLTALG